MLVVGVAALTAVVAVLVAPAIHHAVQEITLPLRHEDIIRQQARDKSLDPALIAAVIYTESHFRDQDLAGRGQGPDADHAGDREVHRAPVRGHDVRGRRPELAAGHIAYGAYYLRYLLHRYGGSEVLALAAYNGGEGNVDHWLGEAAVKDRSLRVQDIPFAETRAYVGKVERAKGQYRKAYAGRLGY